MPHSNLLESNGFNQLAKGDGVYYVYNKNDIYIGQAIQRYGEFSHLERQLMMQLCEPGDIVIEVGANIGAHTIWLAKHVGKHGRVLAFEPQRLVFQALCANVAINSLENVDCYYAALGANNGKITVPELDPNLPTNFGGLTLSNDIQGRQVDCFKLDDLSGAPRVNLIKIDVEGMEEEVLKGGRVLIDKFKPFLYVENDRVEKSESLMNLIDSMGYEMFWHTPPLFNPSNFYAEPENIYPNLASFNMLCAHKDRNVAINGLIEIKDFSLHPLKR